MLVIKVDQDVSVDAIRGEQDQDNKIWDEQRHVEGIGVIQALKCWIEKMGLEVVSKAARREPCGESQSTG